jgi:hypothetical protein
LTRQFFLNILEVFLELIPLCRDCAQFALKVDLLVGGAILFSLQFILSSLEFSGGIAGSGFDILAKSVESFVRSEGRHT